MALPHPAPNRRRHGHRHSPLEFLAALARLIPPPRVHRHRYHGVLAPHARLRDRVTALGRGDGEDQRPMSGPAPESGNIIQLCQSWVESNKKLVGGGDSGSGVWTGGTSSATIVGILWGGNSSGTTFIFSPMNQIEQELGTQTVK